MDKTIRKYRNFEEMKADEYRYWQSRPAHERIAAVCELTEEGYKLKPSSFREKICWRPNERREDGKTWLT